MKTWTTVLFASVLVVGASVGWRAHAHDRGEGGLPTRGDPTIGMLPSITGAAAKASFQQVSLRRGDTETIDAIDMDVDAEGYIVDMLLPPPSGTTPCVLRAQVVYDEVRGLWVFLDATCLNPCAFDCSFCKIPQGGGSFKYRCACNDVGCP